MNPATYSPESALELRSDAATREILDVSDGIDRIMGDRALYARMLSRFHLDYKDGVALIRAALLSRDRATAHRIAHTLKGSAGMIGAHRVHRCACALEQAIRTNSPDEAAALDQLAAVLQQVLDLLNAMLQGMRSRIGSAEMASSKILPDDTALVSELASLLEAGDGAAVDLLEQSSVSLRAVLGEARYRAVANAANEFNFDLALAAMKKSED